MSGSKPVSMDAPTDRNSILETLLGKRGGAPTRSIPQRASGARVPLSYAQRPLWCVDQLSPGDATYNVAYLIGIPGKLSREGVAHALDSIFARHEALRTIFLSIGGVPEQHIAAERRWDPAFQDLSDVPAAEIEKAVLNLVETEAKFRFDLAAGPLTRHTLLSLGADSHILLSCMHHIVCDTWSVGLFDREFRLFYDAYCNGGKPPLPEVAAQYGDYAIWERDGLESPQIESDLEYWRGQLEGVAPLTLPIDRPYPEQRGFPAANELVLLDAELSEGVRQLAARHEATPFMVLLTLYKALLMRLSGQNDIFVGTPNANRALPEIEKMIGFTTTMFALRTKFPDDPSFRAALRQVRSVTIGAYTHQAVPFQALMERIRPQRTDAYLNRLSALRTMFSFQSIVYPSSSDVAVLDVSRFSNLPRFTVPHPTTKADLYLYLREIDGRIIGGIEYDREIFEPETVRRFAGFYLQLAKAMIADPEARIRSAQLLTPAEQHDLLLRSHGRTVHVAPSCLHHRFEATTAVNPDLIAVSDDVDRLTYAQLDANANLVASRLRDVGVEGGTPVALYLERSIEFAIAVIGVLKAGGTCVPIDPTFPEARVRSLLDLANVVQIVTTDDLADRLESHKRSLVRLGRDRRHLDGNGVARPSVDARVTAGSAAFIFFTSGSTGLPNGVVITHTAAASGQIPETALLPLEQRERVLMTSPVTSARVLGELFWPWFSGAEVCVARANGHQDPVYLGEWLAHERIAVASVVPAMLSVLTQTQPRPSSHLRYLFSVGEPLSSEQRDRALAWLDGSGGRLVNVYAQTEACPVAFCEYSAEASPRTIGSPAANMDAFVLDDALAQVPVGVVGELYVAGPALAREYLAQPSLTARRFVPNPHARFPGERLYRTGDLVRTTASGLLEYIGRRDSRVKLRGHRIDLLEVETAAKQHPDVADCAVTVLRGAAVRHEHLCAYVVPARPGVSGSTLGRFLRTQLPIYMVPTRFALLESLPRTRTGKLDREALAELAIAEAAPADDFAPPSTQTERIVAQIWAELLAVERVGIHDNFFDLGGHSLLAVQALARMESEAGVRVSAREIIFGTLAQVARRTVGSP